MDAPSSSFEPAWARFQALDSLLVNETLEWEWTRGRDQYLAFLVPIEEEAVRDHISRVIERIAGIPGVAPYPQRYWHITVKGLGFQVERPARPDELSLDDLNAIAETAAPVLAAQPAFEAHIGLASAFPEVVFLEVWDGGRVRDLNTLLLERLPRGFRYPFDGDAFLPHISIARFTSSDGLSRLKTALAALRDEPPGPPLTLRRVDLIRARLSPNTPTFEPLASYPLRE